jgi:hypothetical protein
MNMRSDFAGCLAGWRKPSAGSEFCIGCILVSSMCLLRFFCSVARFSALPARMMMTRQRTIRSITTITEAVTGKGRAGEVVAGIARVLPSRRPRFQECDRAKGFASRVFLLNSTDLSVRGPSLPFVRSTA